MRSVDVIVPCYRYGRYLRECVESVLKQSHENVRVLILDDASPDDTAVVGAALAQEDSRVTLVVHEKNKGHIATYNEGIDWASGDYLLLLSADDYLLPGALARVVAMLDAHPDVSFVFGKAIALESDGSQSFTENFPKRPKGDGDWIMSGDEFIALGASRNIVPTPTAIVRTALQKQVGGYNPQLPHSGDMEMWLRFGALGAVGVIDTAQAVYRLHANNMSTSYLQQSRLPDLLQRKAAFDCFLHGFADRLPDAKLVEQKAVQAFAYEAVGLASGAFNDADLAASEQLAAYALELFPGVTSSLAWAKLAMKRRVGLKRWQSMRPLIGRWLKAKRA